MLSLERRYAKLVRSYQRLNELRKKDVQTKRQLRTEIKILKAEVRLLEKALREREKSSENTMSTLLTVVLYASARLAEHGDDEGSEKLREWHDTMSRHMQPVADVRILVDLLEQWVELVQFQSDAPSATLASKTRDELRKLTGTD